jgi:plasmid maintenance system antidote protein VapI
MNAINRWLVENKKEPIDLARAVGISRSYMSEIRSGARGVSLDLALRFQEATGISPADIHAIKAGAKKRKPVRRPREAA